MMIRPSLSSPRQILIGFPKQTSLLSNWQAGYWRGERGNAFLERCEIANRESRIFKKLPTFILLMTRLTLT